MVKALGLDKPQIVDVETLGASEDVEPAARGLYAAEVRFHDGGCRRISLWPLGGRLLIDNDQITIYTSAPPQYGRLTACMRGDGRSPIPLPRSKEREDASQIAPQVCYYSVKQSGAKLMAER